MALVINHNLGAERTLNLLEKNQTALGKDLKAAASGAKINDASDGASEYAISRRLEIEERGLGQDIQNVKTGGDLLAVAEGGIREVVENLRDMKQLAINAANDTNTDADRATIEKEFSHRQETIKEIAATTNYNGKLLLAGDYHRDYTRIEEKTIVTNSNKSNGSPTTDLRNAFFADSNATGPSTNSNSNYYKDKDGKFLKTYRFNNNNNMRVGIDFTNAGVNINSVADLDYNPFTVLCSNCDQYINIRFNSKTTNSTYDIVGYGPRQGRPCVEYVIGTAGVSSVADIPKAIFDGISASIPVNNSSRPTKDEYGVTDTTTSKVVDVNHGLHITQDSGKYYFEKVTLDMEIYNGVIEKDGGGSGNPQKIKEKVYYPGNPLVIHDTTHASNAIHVFIDSMHPRAITGKVPMREVDPKTGKWEIIAQRDPNTGEILKDNDGNPIPARYKAPDPTLEDAHVRTRREALEAIDILDMAMNYALDQITDIGAYRMRLEQDEDKITVQQESATGSKSTIQDADMAATMTNLTKHNVLTQAAQMMLAQANQDASRVLSLLQ